MQTALQAGIVGFGSIGEDVARRLLHGGVPGVALAAVAGRDIAKTEAAVARLCRPVSVVPLAELVRRCDIVIECANAASLPEIARAALSAGCTFIAVSASGLTNCPDLVDLACRYGGRVRIATGALPGLDAVRSAAEDAAASVKLTATLLPISVAEEPYITSRNFGDLGNTAKPPICVFRGSAREAMAAFPRHFNVAVALGLAGIGLDRTEVDVFVDARITGAVLNIEVHSEDVDLFLTSRNRASEVSRTSRIVAPSIIAAVRSLVSPVSAGS